MFLPHKFVCGKVLLNGFASLYFDNLTSPTVLTHSGHTINMNVKRLALTFSIAAFLPPPVIAHHNSDEKSVEALTSVITQAKNITTPIKQFIIQHLLPISYDTLLAAEIINQNSRKIPLSKTHDIDQTWINSEDELAIHQEKLSNPCAQQVKRIVKNNLALVEVFVMDNQGAIVCMNNITSDYWQGDESKWKNSYERIGVDIGPLRFDKSAYTNLQQISLPIFDSQDHAVGAITFGINTSRVDGD